MVKGGKILVIDDEPLIRELVGRVLTGEGYAVDLAYNGQDAINRLHADRPDAILLDLMMPGMNGRQFLTTLRSDLGLDLPVVVMTAVPGLGQRALALGATDVIEKPFDIDQLLNKVALAVFRSHPHDAPELPTGGARPAISAEHPDRVIAVIEHDLGALHNLDVILSSAGFTVVVIARITDQLPRLLRALSPTAIVLGVDSTEDDGAAVTAMLRATQDLAEVPLLMFTRSAEPRNTAADGAVMLAHPDDHEIARAVARIVGSHAPPVA